uniref:Pre-rRNA-processing protein TSR2 homolog n=1 Tax=Schizaphis graminum TaxID=13262 RepID=A0A2S2P5B7_SCHGA
MSLSNSSIPMELENKDFKWNDEVNFLNIISTLFNNWPEMKLVLDRTSEVSRNDVYDDIRKFLQNIFDCVLIYGNNCGDKLSDIIKKAMSDDFHLVIEDFSAKEISTRIFNMYDKWFNAKNSTESRQKVIKEIEKLPKPNPIIEFEDLPIYKLVFNTEEIMC